MISKMVDRPRCSICGALTVMSDRGGLDYFCNDCEEQTLPPQEKEMDKKVADVIGDWADEMPPDVRAKFNKTMGEEIKIHTRRESPEDN